jgi:squalene-hopene/tetraprenyl-beta-curcumene cyclase
VVSYALPALIAIGQAIHRHHPPRNPLTRLFRSLTKKKTLRLLEAIQPASGGFLEATPLTSFVTMSLAGSGLADHIVAGKGMQFLVDSARPDGSWAIDTNLATWVTTLSVNALGGELPAQDGGDPDWLLRQQYRTVHPTPARRPAAGRGPTAAAACPTRTTRPARSSRSAPRRTDPEVNDAAAAGVAWLLDLQNSDGGIPTFCRGWGKLPVRPELPRPDGPRDPRLERLALGARRARDRRAFAYLVRVAAGRRHLDPALVRQPARARAGQSRLRHSRVLLCASWIGRSPGPRRRRGKGWLLRAQNGDGGFGGARGSTRRSRRPRSRRRAGRRGRRRRRSRAAAAGSRSARPRARRSSRRRSGSTSRNSGIGTGFIL